MVRSTHASISCRCKTSRTRDRQHLPNIWCVILSPSPIWNTQWFGAVLMLHDASFSVQQAQVSSHLTHHVIMMYRYIRRPVCVCAVLVHAACGAKQYSELGAAVKGTSVLQTQHQVATWTCDMRAIGFDWYYILYTLAVFCSSSVANKLADVCLDSTY